MSTHPSELEGSGLIRALATWSVSAWIVGALLASAAQGQTSGPFTQQQAAAGRTSYQVNCAGCHQADLRGANEAKPLVGPDFLRTWGERTAQELIAFLGVTMPPPPAAPGSLGTQTYVNLAAFLLTANGASPGSEALAATSAVRIGSVADGRMSDAFRQLLASAAPAGGGAAAALPTGLSVTGRIEGLAPVTDAMLLDPPESDWLMIRGNYRAWNYSELDEVTPANVDELRLQWAWSMTDGGWNEPAPIVHDGVLYLNNQGNIVQALDAATGELIWENRVGPVVAANVANRGMATYEDKIFSRRATRGSSRSRPPPAKSSGRRSSATAPKATFRRRAGRS